MNELTPLQRAELLRRRLEAEQARQRGPALSQVNLGIADAVGGLVDLINPFDTPAVSQALGMGNRLTTGSAREGLVSGMQAIGAAGADRAPEGILEAGMRGAGQAAGSAVPAGVAARGLSRLPGIAGNVAGQIGRGLSTPGAFVAETAAGGAAGAAMEASDQQTEGLPGWARGLARGTAAVVAPLGLAGAVAGAQAAGRGISRVSPINNAARMATGAIAPYTRRGAMAVARGRMDELAGSRERALELGERINPNDEFGLTPAQQTGDSRMIALEQAARGGNPVLDAEIERRLGISMTRAREGVQGVGGDVTDAQRYFAQQQEQYTSEMDAVARQALRNADARLRDIRSERFEGDNSLILMEEISRAREAARARERELWGALNDAALVPTANARAAAEQAQRELSRFYQNRDLPEGVRAALAEEGGLGSVETFQDLHGLYSGLRTEARNARAGESTNPNLARIADNVADAILEDLSGENVPEGMAQAFANARAFSAALHERFDRGAVGRLSTRRLAGDEATDPELALNRSVGRQGTEAMTSARNLEAAAAGLTPDGQPGPVNEQAREALLDFVRGRFSDNSFTPEGTLTRAGALRFARNNRELLNAYPELRDEIMSAADQALSAEQVQLLVTSAIERRAQTPMVQLSERTPETAIRAILDAENPVQAAAEIRRAAQGDNTGNALGGVKAVFTDDLIRRATAGGQLNGDRIVALLNGTESPQFLRAAQVILNPDEIGRLRRIGQIVQNLNMAQTSQGALPGQTLSGAQAPLMMQTMARLVGARAINNSPIAQGQGAGVGLQAAQIGSGLGVRLVNTLTADRASRIISDAITDPRLFQALLMDPASPRFEREALPRLLPYLVGGGAASVVQDEPAPGPLRMTLTDPGNQSRNQ